MVTIRNTPTTEDIVWMRPFLHPDSYTCGILKLEWTTLKKARRALKKSTTRMDCPPYLHSAWLALCNKRSCSNSRWMGRSCFFSPQKQSRRCVIGQIRPPKPSE